MSAKFENVEQHKASPPEHHSAWAREAASAYAPGSRAQPAGAQHADLSLPKYCNPALPHISTEDWNSPTGPNSSKKFERDDLKPLPPEMGKDGKEKPKEQQRDPLRKYDPNQPCPPETPGLVS
jgi:hypothetical protein